MRKRQTMRGGCLRRAAPPPPPLPSVVAGCSFLLGLKLAAARDRNPKHPPVPDSLRAGSVLLQTGLPAQADTFEGEIQNGWVFGYIAAKAPVLPSICVRFKEVGACLPAVPAAAGACLRGLPCQRVLAVWISPLAARLLRPSVPQLLVLIPPCHPALPCPAACSPRLPLPRRT